MHRNQALEPQQIAKFCSGSEQFFRNSRDLLTVPKDIADLQQHLCALTVKQEESELKRVEQLEDLSLKSGKVHQQTDSIANATRQMQKKMTSSMFTIMSIAEDIKSIFRMLGTFSRDLFAGIATQGYLRPGGSSNVARVSDVA